MPLYTWWPLHYELENSINRRNYLILLKCYVTRETIVVLLQLMSSHIWKLCKTKLILKRFWSPMNLVICFCWHEARQSKRWSHFWGRKNQMNIVRKKCETKVKKDCFTTSFLFWCMWWKTFFPVKQNINFKKKQGVWEK